MKITHISLSHEQIVNLNPNVYKVLVWFGHAHNDIVAHHRALVLLMRGNDKTIAEEKMFSMHGYMLIRTLISKSFETKRMIEKLYYNDDGLSEKSKSISPNINQPDFEKVKQLFKDHGQLLKNIRNSFSFHFHDKNASGENNLIDLANFFTEESEFDIYVQESHLNSNFHMSESIIQASILKLLEEDRPKESLNKLVELTKNLIKEILDFLNSTLAYLFEIYVYNPDKEVRIEQHEVASTKLSGLSFSLFIE